MTGKLKVVVKLFQEVLGSDLDRNPAIPTDLCHDILTVDMRRE